MKRVELEIYKEDGHLGVALSRMTGERGDGYRIFGPKMAGGSVCVKKIELSAGEIDRLVSELLASKKFLAEPPPEETRDFNRNRFDLP